MLTMLNRMCWNIRGWRLPTHTSGDGGYPSRMGFGHEEWNFQIEDAANGFVYGYLYYNPSLKAKKESGGHFKIGFWGIHPETRAKLFVGAYANASLPTNDDYEILDSTFTRNGIYERRALELCAAVTSMSYDDAIREVTNSVRERWLNFKCPVEDVHHLAQYIPLCQIVKTKKIGQYFARPTFIPDFELSIALRPKPSPKDVSLSKDIAALAEDAYYRESPQNLRLILRRHNILSNEFAKWLVDTRCSNVIQEKDYVDVIFEKEDSLYQAELKICYGTGTTKVIREALGQLLEYNYYPGRTQANRWAIVLDEKPTNDDIAYIRTLKVQLNLPLSLGWRDSEGFVFADGLGL